MRSGRPISFWCWVFHTALCVAKPDDAPVLLSTTALRPASPVARAARRPDMPAPTMTTPLSTVSAIWLSSIGPETASQEKPPMATAASAAIALNFSSLAGAQPASVPPKAPAAIAEAPIIPRKSRRVTPGATRFVSSIGVIPSSQANLAPHHLGACLHGRALPAEPE